MATVSFTIADAEATRVVNAFAAYHGYQDQVINPDYDPETAPTEPEWIPNPQTKAQFLKAEVIAFVRKSVLEQERADAMVAARDAVVEIGGIE